MTSGVEALLTHAFLQAMRKELKTCAGISGALYSVTVRIPSLPSLACFLLCFKCFEIG